MILNIQLFYKNINKQNKITINVFVVVKLTIIA
jgi:hypothetical protein